jgi:phosphopantetheinyl transferase
VPLSLGAPLVAMSGPAVTGRAAAPVAAAIIGPAPASADPVYRELVANLELMASAQDDIVQAYRAPRPAPVAVAAAADRTPRQAAWRREISIDTDPQLVDHTFYRQPDSWPNMVDRFPVVPMTMNLDIMIEAAAKLVPDRTAIAIENVTAYRWLAVAPAADVEITASYDGADRVQVRIGDFATGTIVVAGDYPAPPTPRRRPLTGETTPPISAARLYDDGWMFHGPAYQGVTELGPTARDGIRGTLVSRQARGALLDNAGQLMGYWVMLNTESDRLAFPVRIQRIELFGPHPEPGRALDCTVWIPEMDAALVHADMELCDRGRVWARITDWIDKRFDTDGVVWPVLRFSEHNALSARRDDGYYHCVERWRGAASRELIARRYLCQDEYRAFESMGLRRKRGWLLGRMAVKDAVRDWMWRRGAGAVYPIEIAVTNDATGKPHVSGPFDADLRVSVAHKEDVAVARVAVGADVGIDVERIEPRTDGFAAIAFTDAERSLRSGGGADEWLTRVWSAKEAVAKQLGTGLEGNPRRFEVKEVAGERLLVGMTDPNDPTAPVWVETRHDGDHVVAWTSE